ncbi:YtxH domain-containing protein [Streptococcus suis]|uniref:YtxH domain-containing protein n=1 Tax=Streptococcus suis TaxID=1307 RepID=UPI001ABE03FC|nr:YtxH domain-containing protein [Streptococcus suis]
MVKKSSLLTSIVLGAAGGAAAAVFLASKSGKAIKDKVQDFIKEAKENPEETNAELINKATELKNQAVERFQTVKGQFETGELTVDDLVKTGKEKVTSLKDQSLEKFEQMKEKLSEQALTAKDVSEEVSEESAVIEIDLTSPDAEVSEELAQELAEEVQPELVSEEVAETELPQAAQDEQAPHSESVL